MKNNLIINARRHLGWHRRFASDAGTAALWGLWLWLCRPAIGAVEWLFGARFGLQATAHKLLTVGVPNYLEGTAFTLVGTSGALLVWNSMNARRTRRVRPVELPDYAAHFGLSANELAEARASAVCVLHHDERGRIVRLETQRA